MSEFQPTRFGKYLLLDKISSGGMAQLYRAKIIGAQGFEKLVAIKQILPHLAEETEFFSCLIEEAKLAALLTHQNIVQIHDFGSIEGTYFITMEYLLGKDLRIVSNKSKEKGCPFSVEQCLYLTSRICAGLDYAHKLKDFQGEPLNIIHRDISPQNIMITYEGDVKIVDFGIAKARNRTSTTQVGLIKGKVAYMSPEQASGKPVDCRSDIFSVGILLYEMVSGKRMYTGDTFEILAKVSRAGFEPPEAAKPGLPPNLYKILRLALAENPEQRYQSADEMLADLEECMFALSLRPTVRGLAQYMKELFKEEIVAEEEMIRKSAEIDSAAEIKTEKDGQADEKTQIVEKEEARGKRGKKWRLYGGLTAGCAAVIAITILFLLKINPLALSVNAMQAGPVSFDASKASAEDVNYRASVPLPAKPSGRISYPIQKAEALRGEASTLLNKEPEKAKDLLIEANKLDPGSLQGLFQLGLAYMKLGEYPRAIVTYHRASELDPQFPDTYFNLGYGYAKIKNYARAEEMYSRAVKLFPSYLDEALFNLAMVQEKQGKKKECTENLEQALKVNPQNELAKKFLEKLQSQT